MMREQISKSQKLQSEFTHAQKLDALTQHGITPEMLKKAIEEAYIRGTNEGFSRGYQQGAEGTLAACYAAILIVLSDRMDEDQLFDLISAVDNKVALALSNDDLVQETLEKTGLRMEFDDPIARVQKT